jgi:hypothetical protein
VPDVREVHLVRGAGERQTLCGQSNGPRPAVPYTHAQFKWMTDRAREKQGNEPMNWCDECVEIADTEGLLEE